MIDFDLMREQGILVVSPKGPLEQRDFVSLAESVDPYLAAEGRLIGLMIYTESFPGWDDFAALVSHLKFVRNHHRQIRRVVGVSDSGFLSVLPRFAAHFVHAEIKHFPHSDRQQALDWLLAA